MARPPKLKDKEQKKLLDLLKAGGLVSALAVQFGVTIQYIYKLRRDALALATGGHSDLIDNGTGIDDLINLKRSSMGRMQCFNCSCQFERYKGEERKAFCSSECYHGYQEKKFPSKDADARYAYPIDTKECQAKVFETNARFFPLAEESNSDELAAQ